MREIKFRAWDKVSKQMIGCYMWGLNMDFTNGQIYSGNMNVTDKLELMQYTGLHDKDGKEIWEGDIVRVCGLLEFGVTEMDIDEKCKVVYYPPVFGCDCLYKRTVKVPVDFPASYDYDGFPLMESNDEGYEYEVIGNIYEEATHGTT